MMRKGAILAQLLLTVALISCGCGGGSLDDRLVELRGEQEKMKNDLNVFSMRMAATERKLEKLSAQIGDRSALPDILTEGTDSRETAAATGKPIVSPKTYHSELDRLREEVAWLREEVIALRRDTGLAVRGFEGDIQRIYLRDPVETFQAFSDPPKLAERLEKFELIYRDEIEDYALKPEFEQEVGDLVKSLRETTFETVDDKYAYVNKALETRLAATEDERERERIEGQLQSIEQAEGERLDRRLNRFIMRENMDKIRDLARKYSITGDKLRENGLWMGGRLGYSGGRRR